jgi:hypothetical protein
VQQLTDIYAAAQVHLFKSDRLRHVWHPTEGANVASTAW